MEKEVTGSSTNNEETLSTTTENKSINSIKTKENAPLRIKLLILICMLLLPVGSHFLEATMGTLKTVLKKTMHINNTQFGILMSAVKLLNTLLPLLAGAFVDDTNGFGSIRTTSFISFLILLGSLFVSISASTENYPVMVIGQMIYGLGGSMIVTMQEAILSKWFRNQQLAIVIGFKLCSSRLTQCIAKIICYPIVNATGNPNAPIYISTVICIWGFIMNIIYWYVMCKQGWATLSGKEIMDQNQKNVDKSKGDDDRQSILTILIKSIRWIVHWIFFLPPMFWMIPWIQMIMSSSLSSFDDIATEFIEFRYQTTSIMAGYQSSLTQVVPIVAAPIMGIIIHKFGRRLTSLFMATLFLILSMILLGWTRAPPAIGMILFSCALSFGPVSVLSSTSLLLPSELVGLGMGIHKCANNIGTAIVSLLVGYVQDLTYHDGDPNDNHSDLMNEYNGVMILYLCLACGSSLFVIVFWYMDRINLKGWLQNNKKERDRRLQLLMEQQEYQEMVMIKGNISQQQLPSNINEKKEEDQVVMETVDKNNHSSLPNLEVKEKEEDYLKLTGNRLLSKKSYLYPGIYCFWLLLAWIAFFTFALMPVYLQYQSN